MTTVYVSSVISASVDDVWALVRKFNALPEWHPAVADSVIENDEPEDRVGCIRRFTQRSGAVLREQLCALDDIERSVTYKIVEAALPVENYFVTVRLFPVTVLNHTFISHSCSFDCEKQDKQRLIELLVGVFELGFSALQDIFVVDVPSRTMMENSGRRL